LPPSNPSGTISSWIRWTVIAASSPGSRWIAPLNGSSFEPADGRRYRGGSDERNARIVSRDNPVRVASPGRHRRSGGPGPRVPHDLCAAPRIVAKADPDS
jgi:hypothetical protein